MIDIELAPRENLYIFNLSDFHIGNKSCNMAYLRYMAKHIRELKGQIVINILGDVFEAGSKKVGNSAFKQILSLNKQKKRAFNILNPLLEQSNITPGYATPGNHEARLQELDFDFMEDFVDLLNFASNFRDRDLGLNDDGHFICSPDFVQKIIVNGKPIKIYGTHGTGSSKRLDLAMSKIVRETTDVDADIIAMGHLHRCHNFPVFVKTSKDEGSMKRKHYSFTGHFLRYKNSYANAIALPILPEAFTRLDIVDVHDKLHIKGNEFFIDRYRSDLFKI